MYATSTMSRPFLWLASLWAPGHFSILWCLSDLNYVHAQSLLYLFFIEHYNELSSKLVLKK
jgi:hypothetical protein